jgi:hypothetical protein
MSLRLYDLANEYRYLLNDLTDETGAVTPAALERLDELKDPIETKCINVVKVFKSLEAERIAIEAERKAMQAREKALAKQIESMKDYLLTNMEKCEISEIKCPKFVIKLRKNPPSTVIVDEFLIPSDYNKIKIELDKEKIRSDLLNGVIIPGAKLESKNRIEIK